jgi:hypothetical protein
MKTTRIAALVFFALGAGSIMASPLTQSERQRLVAHLGLTESWLADEVSGLSSTQIRFRPSTEAWSILEVVEHLVISEAIYWQDLQRAMRSSPRQKPAGSDADVLWYGIDRTHRQKAVAAEEPKGELRDVGAGLTTFRKLRAEMLRYARTTVDDLRSHVVERERSDAYQWFLLISTHCQRHILQIREIKAGARFPKK